MKTPAPADLQRWSEEVARDPRSLAFLPLARAYRRQGMRDEAMRLCVRGLQAYPSHIEAHGLLAMLYLEAGQHEKAGDEWSMVLRMDADNFDALRGLGFCYLEQDQLSRARQMLERAALLRPADPAVQEALRVLGTRQELAEEGLSRRGSPEQTAEEAEAWQREEPARPDRRVAAVAAAAAAVQAPVTVPGDPTSIFDELITGQVQGALLVDPRGLVVAGRLEGGDADLLGAVLGEAVMEATRTAGYLGMGAWRGILLDAGDALLQLAPAAGDSIVVVVARRGAPAGWLARLSAQAAQRAARFMEEYA